MEGENSMGATERIAGGTWEGGSAAGGWEVGPTERRKGPGHRGAREGHRMLCSPAFLMTLSAPPHQRFQGVLQAWSPARLHQLLQVPEGGSGLTLPLSLTAGP